MPGIIHTPGTVWPVPEPGEFRRAMVWPVTPKPSVKRPAMQWQSMPRKDEPAGTSVGYTRYDYISGNLAVYPHLLTGESPPAAPDSFTLAGARYAPDGTHARTGAQSSPPAWLAETDGPFAPSGIIELGTVEVKYGGDFVVAGGVNSIGVDIGYVLTLAGVSDTTYELEVLGSLDPDSSSDTIRLGLAFSNPSETSFADEDLDDIKVMVMQLRREGSAFADNFDVIYLAVRITATVTFVMEAGTPGGDLPQTIVDTALTYTDTLYGAASEPSSVDSPDIPFIGYERESFATAGTITLS